MPDVTSPTQDLRSFFEERAPLVVDAWYDAVQRSAVAFRSPEELRARLSEIWAEATTFLLREGGTPQQAEAIGASFMALRVRAGAVGQIPIALVSSLHYDVPSHLKDVIRERVSTLMVGITSGLYREGTQTLLDEQEEIRAAYARSLRLAEERLRVVNAGIESSLNAVALIDLEGMITYVNGAFLKMWGLESDHQVLGHHIAAFGEWEGDIETTLRLLAERGGWMGEVVALRADGSRFDVQASVSAVADNLGQPTQLMTFFVDVTRRKTIQEALRRRAIQAAFLNKIGEEIAGERTADEVLERAVQLASETFGFHRVSVLLLDPQAEALEVAATTQHGTLRECARCGRSARDGVTGWVAQHNRTLVVDDVTADPRYWECPADPQAMGSELAVPISGGDHVIGVLDVQSPMREAFGSSDRVVLETLADQIAVALDNAKLYQTLEDELEERRKVEEALRKSLRRIEAVHEIDQAILGARSAEEIAESVVDRLYELVPCQRASIDVFDWENDEILVLAATQTTGEGQAAQGTRFPLTLHAWFADFWERREAVLVPDARELPHESPLIRLLTGAGIKSFLTAPIGFRDELMGILTLGSDCIAGFEAEDKPIVAELADTVSIAIQQARLFDSVKQQGDRLRRAIARLAEAEETERRRVVRELHDQVGQNLTALDLNISLVRTHVERRGIADLTKRLDDSLALVAQTNKRIRELMSDLRPPVLDDYGLLSTLHWYGDRFTSRTNIEVDVQGREEVSACLSAQVENALFRICQEALNNTAKHAQAGLVTIGLSCRNGVIRLRISDDGVGFEHSSHGQSGWGLLTMRERAESIGAACRIEQNAAGGTSVVVDVSARQEDRGGAGRSQPAARADR